VSARDLVDVYNELDRMDLRTMRVVEAAHRRHEYVPVELIARWLDEDELEVAEVLRKLHRLGILKRRKGAYVGYRLTLLGYDILALQTLRKLGYVERISPTPVGVGKESVVYAGESALGEKVAIKLHRVGTSSFKHVRKFRSWIGDRRHLTILYESRLSARMEYKALVVAYRVGARVPKPVAVNRHAVVMEFVDGVELYRVRELVNAKDVLDEIVDNVLKVFEGAGIIHGDLSEYNVLLDQDEGVWIIDWPQWIPYDWPNAEEVFKRDLENIARYFSKHYALEVDLSSLVSKAFSSIIRASPRELFEESMRELIEEERELNL